MCAVNTGGSSSDAEYSQRLTNLACRGSYYEAGQILFVQSASVLTDKGLRSWLKGPCCRAEQILCVQSTLAVPAMQRAYPVGRRGLVVELNRSCCGLACWHSHISSRRNKAGAGRSKDWFQNLLHFSEDRVGRGDGADGVGLALAAVLLHHRHALISEGLEPG